MEGLERTFVATGETRRASKWEHGGESRSGMIPSPMSAVERFRDTLRERGYFSMVRRARGRDADAACGQLAIDELRMGS